MVLIVVENFEDKDSLAVYELPEGSLIIDLKAEIEATEGIPMGHQRLVRDKLNNDQDLKDNENIFDFLIPGGSSKAVIYLIRARVFCHLKRRHTTECNETSHRHPEEVIGVFVDLDKPVRACFVWGTEIGNRYKFDLSLASMSILGSDGRPTISISDLDQSFSYYGVRNGDTIHITYVPWNSIKEDIWFGLQNAGYGGDPVSTSTYRSGDGKGAILRAQYDWNGEIMHPNIKGLPLKHAAFFVAFEMSKDPNFKLSPGWLYGSPIYPSEVNSSAIHLRRRVAGFFPENFVSLVDINKIAEQHLDVTTTEILDLNIPPLPHFHFPPARGMTFRMPISDKGHSFLKFTVNYECVASPVDPTHATISLLCTTHDIRRISAVSVFITIPDCALLDVQVCENEAHQKEIHTDKEVTETQSKGKQFDRINIGTQGATIQLQGGVSKNYSLDATEKGQKVSRRKVTAGIDKEDTIFWNLKAPASKLDEDGLDGEESITLVLKEKPVEFKYKCRVTHARNGIEKTTQCVTDRSWLNLF